MSQSWIARMIAPDTERDSAPLLRRRFEISQDHGELAGAEILATALGLCEVFVNGRPVSDDVLTPGWSSYEWRLRYARWNVTTLIERASVIGISIGNGWHTGYLGFTGKRALYGTERAALAELRLTFADGFTETIATDESWESGPSAITSDDLYNGQSIDACLVDPTWCKPGPAPEGWTGVRVIDFDRSRLTPYVGPPVRRQEEIEPQRVWTSPSGATLVDFGQNLVGWVTMRVQGGAGTVVTLRHAEVLESDELGVRPLRRAKATDRYTLSGNLDTFEPTFTFHGFRYVEVDGWPGTLDDLARAIRAVVISSDLTRTGFFSCSEPLLNQLHSNIVWGMHGNFVDVPTDCPQRDERLGWTGDIAAFATTAVYLYDVNHFLQDWLLDLAAEQNHANGVIPLVIPDNMKYETIRVPEGFEMPEVPIMALWNDAACWVPWAAWQAYGDERALTAQFPSMAAYTRRIARAISDRGLLESGFQLGDWLDPTAPPEAPMNAKADRYVVATACVFRSASIAAEAARVLGRGDEVAEFAALADRIRTAFNEHYVTDGRIQSDATAVYALAIAFGLLDAADRQAAGDRLAQLVVGADYRVTTGFAGTPFITQALSDTGHLDTAYRLLLERECPSWLYPVTMGATTIWERWDAMLPDGSINPGEMTSFNHYALGAVGDWIHRVIGGLSPIEPGYRTILIEPRPGGGITWAKVDLTTPHGQASVHWLLDGDRMSIQADVPPGCTAVLRLPGAPETTVGAGHHELTALIDLAADLVKER
jgi:alpha-L-rhamnosidase